ncbi:MAG: gamma-glutamylcyclotransferase [Cytophagales bacterium]|nr:gamma-glutamylcyclotransferase [Cytophagales bacterium]
MYLFVYGTLMRKCKTNEWSVYLQKNAKYMGEAKVKGELYKIDFYPGLVSGDGWVYGEVYQLKNPESTLHFLDQYEDYQEGDTENSLYLRQETSVVLLKEKKSLQCLAYYYNKSIEGLKKYTDGKFSEAL